MGDSRQVLSMLAADAKADAAVRGDTGLQAHKGRAYQMVTVPVKAPTLIGQVSMGFPLAATLPADLRTLSSLGLFLLARSPGGQWQPLAIAGASAPDDALRAVIDGGAAAASAEIDGESTAVWEGAKAGKETNTALVYIDPRTALPSHRFPARR